MDARKEGSTEDSMNALDGFPDLFPVLHLVAQIQIIPAVPGGVVIISHTPCNTQTQRLNTMSVRECRQTATFIHKLLDAIF